MDWIARPRMGCSRPFWPLWPPRRPGGARRPVSKLRQICNRWMSRCSSTTGLNYWATGCSQVWTWARGRPSNWSPFGGRRLRCRRWSSGDLQTFVHLLDTSGQMWSGEDRLDLEPLAWPYLPTLWREGTGSNWDCTCVARCDGWRCMQVANWSLFRTPPGRGRRACAPGTGAKSVYARVQVGMP